MRLGDRGDKFGIWGKIVWGFLGSKVLKKDFEFIYFWGGRERGFVFIYYRYMRRSFGESGVSRVVLIVYLDFVLSF